MTRSIAVKGTVTSFDWTNPHAYIYLDVKDEKGVIEKWSAEMGSVAMLARAGWKRDTVKPGDGVTLIGKPSKDGKPAMLLDRVFLAGGQELPASDLGGVGAANQGAKAPKEWGMARGGAALNLSDIRGEELPLRQAAQSGAWAPA
jgi:hypothetical protein